VQKAKLPFANTI